MGLRYTLLKVYDRYRVPVMITENGIGCVDRMEEDGSVHDPYRIAYLRDHIAEMRKAVDEGVNSDWLYGLGLHKRFWSVSPPGK